jgi:hypothetical protein
VWQAVAGGIGYIYRSSAGCYYSLHHLCQVGIIASAGIFAKKLYIIGKAAGKSGCFYGTLQYSFAGAVELILNMQIGSANAGMYPGPGSIAQGGRCRFYIFFYRPAEGANRCIFYSKAYLLHTFKVAGRRYGEARLYNIHPKFFQQQGNFQFFAGIEFTPGHLFTIAQGGIKNKNLLSHINLFDTFKKLKEIIFLPLGKNDMLLAVKLAGDILAAQIKISCQLRMLTR